MAAELVELTVMGSRPEADLLVERLRCEGIGAFAKGDYEGSYYPMGAVHVFVAVEDESRAQEVMDRDYGLEADPGHWVNPHRKRRSGLVLLAVYLGMPLAAVIISLAWELTR